MVSLKIGELQLGFIHRTDQGRIWNNIAEKSKRMKVKSPTLAMSDVFEHYDDKLSDYSDSFHFPSGKRLILDLINQHCVFCNLDVMGSILMYTNLNE